MVQICSSCNDKHSHLSEGGTQVVPVSTVAAIPLSNSDAGLTGNGGTAGMMYNTGGIVGSSNATGPGGSSGMSGTGGGAIITGGGGRYTPSEKSLANSDSASNVRFKVCTSWTYMCKYEHVS